MDVTEQLKKAEASGDINSNSCRRLEAMYELLIKCQVEGRVAFEVDTSPSKTCILGWSKMLVKNPVEFNYRIRDMIRVDMRGVCRRANGRHATQLKNPTWSVYELFRGVSSRSDDECRGSDGTRAGEAGPSCCR
jgi:hypothetical protein